MRQILTRSAQKKQQQPSVASKRDTLPTLPSKSAHLSSANSSSLRSKGIVKPSKLTPIAQRHNQRTMTRLGSPKTSSARQSAVKVAGHATTAKVAELSEKSLLVSSPRLKVSPKVKASQKLNSSSASASSSNVIGSSTRERRIVGPN